MTCLVFGYEQPAQPQPLARVGQTRGDETAGLVLGEPRLTGRGDVRRVLRGAGAGARGHAMCREGRNAFSSYTN